MEADTWMALSILGSFFFVWVTVWADLAYWRHCQRTIDRQFAGRGIPSSRPDL